MKSLLIIKQLLPLLFAFYLSCIWGQHKFIKLENRVGKEILRIGIGDQFLYSLYDEEGLREEIVRDVKGDGQFIITNQTILRTSEVASIVINKEGTSFLTYLLKAGGGSLFFSGLVSLLYENKVWEAIPIGLAAAGTGYLIGQSERKKIYRLGKKGRYLKVVDISLDP